MFPYLICYVRLTKGFLVQYADDTQFLHSRTIDNLGQIIKDTEDTLMKCRRYFLRNDLMFNSSKTQCIFIGNRQLISKISPNILINFNGKIIYPSKRVKNLDRYLLFDTHINILNKKVMGILMYISRVIDKLEKQNRIIVIKTLVLSLIEYCIRICGITNESLIYTVQNIQNFKMRVAVEGEKKYDHISPFFRELTWLTIKQKHRFDVGKTVL